MKQQVFVIHGGNAFNTYDEFLLHLKTAEVSLGQHPKDWKQTLRDMLGDDYEAAVPSMPNKQNAKYSEWKIWFERYIPLLADDTIFVGHSLGGVFLAKYLSENEYPHMIRATFLVAAPYNTKIEQGGADFMLGNDLAGFAQQGGKIHLYHSKDDSIVPFSALEEYHAALPSATVRIFSDRQHFNQETFPELVEDIKNLH